ncbi:hypothetical protein ACIQWR_39790 [Streptomyces sp. NPDC098789]|uniref:hypothetical protein n=1 Tax=Streptomyces sp. NPDC098789 TaxID=3366098 RepID=UPI0038120F92
MPTSQVLATTAGEFLRTYLTGGKDGAGLERYLSPGVRLAAPVGAGYVRVDVEDVVADTERAGAKDVPADGVRARVAGEDQVGTRWPLVYRLEMITRAGRWEVAALDAGSAPSVSPAPSVSAGAR